MWFFNAVAEQPRVGIPMIDNIALDASSYAQAAFDIAQSVPFHIGPKSIILNVWETHERFCEWNAASPTQRSQIAFAKRLSNLDDVLALNPRARASLAAHNVDVETARISAICFRGSDAAMAQLVFLLVL